MHLARSQENTQRHLILIAADSEGIMYAPATVEFRIVKISDGSHTYPGAGLYHDVTTEGKLSTGLYYATQAASTGWTPDGAAALERHRIDWRYTDSDGVTTRTFSQVFDITEAALAMDYWTYVTPYDVRISEGVDSTELSDARMLDLIERVQEHIELMTGQFFRPVFDTVRSDGDGSKSLRFGVPIIAVQSVKINNSTQELSTSAYRVYAVRVVTNEPARPIRDRRTDSKISLRVQSDPGPFNTGGLFGSDIHSSRFFYGTQGHEVVGVWGYLEPGMKTPRLIREAALKLLLNNAELLAVGDAGGSGTGSIRRERTDRHEIEYGSGPTLSSSLATTPEVEEILQLFKSNRGIRLASPATGWL